MNKTLSRGLLLPSLILTPLLAFADAGTSGGNILSIPVGARAIGMGHEIGSLEVGKKADIAIIDMRKPHLMPMWMPVHRLVHQVLGSDVDTVIVEMAAISLAVL